VDQVSVLERREEVLERVMEGVGVLEVFAGARGVGTASEKEELEEEWSEGRPIAFRKRSLSGIVVVVVFVSIVFLCVLYLVDDDVASSAWCL
jgi:hypothetical protein